MGFEGALDVFQVKKKERMGHVISELLERGGEADLNEFKGSLSVNYGIKGKTLDEYFQDLKNAKMISINNGKIELLWDKDRTEEWLKKQGIDTTPKQTKAT